MTSSSADPGRATATVEDAPGAPPHRPADVRGSAVRLGAAVLLAAGALLGACTTATDATSALYTDTETAVTTVRTAADFDAPRTPPAPPPAATPTATPTATTAPEPAPPRDDLRGAREGRGR